MKRSIALVAIALTTAASAYSQATLQGFQNAFSSFTGDMASSLAVNSTIGSNWSDAYVGGFPHFGVGIASGAAFTAADGVKPLFDALGQTLPSGLDKLGLPFPAIGATFKIGLPFLPLDIGIKGGYIPPSVGASLKSLTGVTLDYKNIGIQLRYALVKQNILFPNVSIGAAYNYQQGSVKAPTGIPSQSLSYLAYNVTLASPDLNLGWTSNTFDFTAQVSKLLLFIVPYAGLGYSVGSSTVTGGLDSTITTNYPTGLAGLASYIQSLGGTAPDFGATGFAYSSTSTTPVFRLYGGFSLRIIILDFDTQVMYVPSTKALGASLTTRVQL